MRWVRLGPRYVSLKASEANVRRGPSLTHRIDWVYKRRAMPLRVTADGRFVFGFGRDAPETATLEVTGPDGSVETRALAIEPRTTALTTWSATRTATATATARCTARRRVTGRSA